MSTLILQVPDELLEYQNDTVRFSLFSPLALQAIKRGI